MFKKFIIVLSFLASSSAFSQGRIPKEFDLVRENVGKGAYSQVHLLQLRETSDYFAIKRPHDINDARNISNFYKHVSLHAGWKLLGLTDVPMYYYENKKGRKVRSFYILHGYVEGPTLEKAYVEEGYRLRLSDPMTSALADFVDIIVSNRVSIHDINAKNIVYDTHKKRWQLIDSQGMNIHNKKTYPTFKESFVKTRDRLLRKWSEGNNHVGRKELERFFEHYEKKRLPKIIKKNPTRVEGFEDYLKSLNETRKTKNGHSNYTKVIPEIKNTYDWKKVRKKVTKSLKCKATLLRL